MDTRMINFVIPNKLLKDIDRLAKKESRSRSELLRESVRRYLMEKEQKIRDFNQIRGSAGRIKMTEEEAIKMIDDIRKTLPMNQ